MPRCDKNKNPGSCPQGNSLLYIIIPAVNT